MRRVLVFALLAACATDADAIIGNVEKVEMPATARIGEPITVTITTTGGGCIRPSSTIMTATPEATTITPYDVYPDGAACTRELIRIEHSISVKFDKAGPAEVRVRSHWEDDTHDIVQKIVVEY